MPQPRRSWWSKASDPLPPGRVVTVALLRRRYHTPFAEQVLTYYGFLRPWSRGSVSRWARCVIERELPTSLDPYFELSVREALEEIPQWLELLRTQIHLSIGRHSKRELAQSKYSSLLLELDYGIRDCRDLREVLLQKVSPETLAGKVRLNFPARLWAQIPTFHGRLLAVIEVADGVTKSCGHNHPVSSACGGSLLLAHCPKGALHP